MTNPVKFFKALADKSRLSILNALMEKPLYVEVIAERLQLSVSTISHHLKKLEEAGLVYSEKDQYYVVYHLKKEKLNQTLSDLLDMGVNEKKAQDRREEEYRNKVINSFIEYGKLKSIPVQRKKRRIILEQIAKSFEPGRVYPEREVNIIIADYHDDFCTLRRELIGEKIMHRENGLYTLVEDE